MVSTVSTVSIPSVVHRLAILARLSVACMSLAALFFVGSVGAADERSFRVAVIAHSPPLSYSDENGKLSGFNVEIARELCASMKVSCQLLPMSIDRIVGAVADDEVAFAIVAFIPTTERRQKVLFSKAYFQSLSVWLAKPSIVPGDPRSKVVVIKGSAQAIHAEAMGWNTIAVGAQKEISAQLCSGSADAAVMPMLGALSIMQEKPIQQLGLKSTPLFDPALTGALHMPISPKLPHLVSLINAAIDELKRDGRFDRINSKFIPFRLL
jgi:ABC-type amino acid transport substrate-binding protein